MHGSAGLTERSAEPYLPYLGHIRPDAVVLAGGALLAIGQLHGLPRELSAASERTADARLLNGLLRNIADDSVTLGAHLVRHRPARPPDIGERR